MRIILQKLQRFDEAIKNWRNATKINPNLISAHINLGHIFFDLKPHFYLIYQKSFGPI